MPKQEITNLNNPTKLSEWNEKSNQHCTQNPLSPWPLPLSLPAPPPPLRGRRDRMRVPKISGKGVLFVRQSPAREL